MLKTSDEFELEKKIMRETRSIEQPTVSKAAAHNFRTTHFPDPSSCHTPTWCYFFFLAMISETMTSTMNTEKKKKARASGVMEDTSKSPPPHPPKNKRRENQQQKQPYVSFGSVIFCLCCRSALIDTVNYKLVRRKNNSTSCIEKRRRNQAKTTVTLFILLADV